jgi:IPT/TIG domain-containing protein
MRESFAGALSGALNKSMMDNGINPNGGELSRISASILALVADEFEGIATDPKELQKVQADAKAKADKKAAQAAADKKAAAVAAQPAPLPVPLPPPGGHVPTNTVILSVSPTSGKVGTTITLKGTGFGLPMPTSTLTLSGKALTASTWSDTVIVSSVAANCVTGPLVVTVNGIASVGFPFTVLP